MELYGDREVFGMTKSLEKKRKGKGEELEKLQGFFRAVP